MRITDITDRCLICGKAKPACICNKKVIRCRCNRSKSVGGGQLDCMICHGRGWLESERGVVMVQRTIAAEA